MLTVFTLALGASALFLRERRSMVHVAEVTAAWVIARAEHPVGEPHEAAANVRKPAQRVLTSAPVTRREP